MACIDCGVSVCSTCSDKYQLKSHTTEDLVFSTNTRTDPIEFETTLRSKLPSQLHIPAKSIAEIATVGKDVHGVSGLGNFMFQLTRVKRDRNCWKVWYSAKIGHGSNANVAQMIVHVGSLEFASKSFGMSAYLHCYQPTLQHKVAGRMEECLRLIIPKNGTSVGWEIREEPDTVCCKLVGSSPLHSMRIKMGILPTAQKAVKTASSAAAKRKKADLKEDGELGRRRWEYADGWEKWPDVIAVGDGQRPDTDGEYEKLKCEQTSPHSAIWRRRGSGDRRYILVLPNVSRIAPDIGAISSSPNVADTASVIMKLNKIWQPSDTLQEKFQEVKGCTAVKWKGVSKAFAVTVPLSKVKVEPAKFVKDPNPTTSVTVATIKELDSHTVEELKRHHIGSDGKLNIFDGIKGMKTARTFSASCAPALQQATTFNYSLDDRDEKGWYVLTAGKGHAFGYDPVILPSLPSERWYKDVERSKDNKLVYTRRPDPDKSKKFKKLIKDRPHGWEVFVRKNNVVVNIRPHVLAQLSALALIADRGLGDMENIRVHYRLSNIRTQADPEVTEFRIQSTNKEESTDEWGFNKMYSLYARQKQGLTRVLAIENGERTYEETEMSEKELPGTGFTLATKASRNVPLRGGVIADAIGAGKTVISIALILKGLMAAREKNKASKDLSSSGATLIVVPPGLIEQWRSEFNKFVDPKLKIKIIEIYNLATLRKTTVNEIREADVVICPVDILEGESKSVKDRALYLKHIFDFTVKNLDKKQKEEVLNDQYNLSEAPKLPTTWGAKENIGVEGIWVAKSSADPYGQGGESRGTKQPRKEIHSTHILTLRPLPRRSLCVSAKT
jgi:hypothetical protein